MSLPGRIAFKFRENKAWVILAALILAVPCVAAGSSALGLTLGTYDAFNVLAQTPSAQEPSKEFQKGKEMGEAEARRREERERDMQGLAERDPRVKAELAERARREQIELSARATMQAALVNLARIPIDQAIQIATSQQPGKVLACSLVGEHWESLGKLAKDGKVLYHTVIISGDEANPVTTHVLINAMDGTVFKTEKEERGKERSREQRW